MPGPPEGASFVDVVLESVTGPPAPAVSGLALHLDSAGITMSGPGIRQPRHLAWSDVGSPRCRSGALMPDGSPGAAISGFVGGRQIRWLIPAEQLPPERVAELDGILKDVAEPSVAEADVAEVLAVTTPAPERPRRPRHAAPESLEELEREVPVEVAGQDPGSPQPQPAAGPVADPGSAQSPGTADPSPADQVDEVLGTGPFAASATEGRPPPPADPAGVANAPGTADAPGAPAPVDDRPPPPSGWPGLESPPTDPGLTGPAVVAPVAAGPAATGPPEQLGSLPPPPRNWSGPSYDQPPSEAVADTLAGLPPPPSGAGAPAVGLPGPPDDAPRRPPGAPPSWTTPSVDEVAGWSSPATEATPIAAGVPTGRPSGDLPPPPTSWYVSAPPPSGMQYPEPGSAPAPQYGTAVPPPDWMGNDWVVSARRRRIRRRWIVALLVLIVVLAVVGLVLGLTLGSGSTHSAPAGPATSATAAAVLPALGRV